MVTASSPTRWRPCCGERATISSAPRSAWIRRSGCSGTDPVPLAALAGAASRRGAGLAAGPPQFLTGREREALARLVRGESPAGMARAMGVHISPARPHIDAVLCKLGAHTRLEAV